MEGQERTYEVKAFESICTLRFPYRLLAGEKEEAEQMLRNSRIGAIVASLVEEIVDGTLEVGESKGELEVGFGDVKEVEEEIDCQDDSSSMTSDDCNPGD